MLGWEEIASLIEAGTLQERARSGFLNLSTFLLDFWTG